MGKEELVADNTFYSLFAKKDARGNKRKPKVMVDLSKLKDEDVLARIKF